MFATLLVGHLHLNQEAEFIRGVVRASEETEMIAKRHFAWLGILITVFSKDAIDAPWKTNYPHVGVEIFALCETTLKINSVYRFTPSRYFTKYFDL